MSDVGLIAEAVSKIADIIAEFQKSKIVRHMKIAIDAGEKYIQESEKEEPNVKLLEKYRYRFFKYN